MIKQNNKATEYYIGLMSGTSTDGADGVIARFQANIKPTIIAHTSRHMPRHLRNTFLALNVSGPNELEQAYMAANQLSILYHQVCLELLEKSALQANQITAIGAHGQTVRHRPEQGFSIQLNAPALLAELSHIPVIADFRSRDIAAGGQGAPLVPIFHQAIFAHKKSSVILNLGGIAISAFF